MVASFAGCAKINHVTKGTIRAIHEVKDGSWETGGIAGSLQGEDGEGEAETAFVDKSVLDKEFEAGTYGGVEFKSMEDVVKYYVEAYDYTKTLTASYTDNGKKIEGYKLMGDENLRVENLLVEGKANGMVDKLVPGILGTVFKPWPKGLVPSTKYTAAEDAQEVFDKSKSHLTADDVLACNVTDNGDGTITIVIQPKAQILSMPGEDSQGRFFNVLGDISATVEQVGVTFSQGGINDNFVVNYAGGTGTVKIDTKTKEITEAHYVMNVHIDVTHANIKIIKDKSASMDIVYTNDYPCPEKTMNDVKLIRN